MYVFVCLFVCIQAKACWIVERQKRRWCGDVTSRDYRTRGVARRARDVGHVWCTSWRCGAVGWVRCLSTGQSALTFLAANYFAIILLREGILHCESKKPIRLTFDRNFGKCRPVFKILLLPDSQGNSLYNHCRVFHLTLTMLLHYRVKFKNLK